MKKFFFSVQAYSKFQFLKCSYILVVQKFVKFDFDKKKTRTFH